MDRFKLIKKSFFQIISFGIATRILNIIKSWLLVYYIASNYDMDTYTSVFVWIMFLTGIIADALISALILIFQEIDRDEGIVGRFKFFNDTFNLCIIISIVLIFIGYGFAPKIIGKLGGNLDQGIRLFRIGIPLMGLYILRAISVGYLRADHRFLAGAKSGVADSLVYIIYLTIFKDRFGLEGLMIASLFAVLSQVIVLTKPVFEDGYRYRFHMDFKYQRYGGLLLFFIPIALYLYINQLNGRVDDYITLRIASGSIPELDYSRNIVEFLYSLIIVSMVMPLFPILSENFNHSNLDELNKNINFGIYLFLVVGTTISIILLIAPRPIVELFYRNGGLSAETVLRTSQMLEFYALGLVGLSLNLLIIRIYYAIQDMKTPIILGLVGLGLKLVLNIVFSGFMGGHGIALSTTVSGIIISVLGIYDLNKRLDFISLKTFKFLRAGIVGTVLYGSFLVAIFLD